MGQWITPPSLPPTTYCRRLLIPNSPQWIGAVSGALRELTFESAWLDTNGISAEEAAERALEMYNLYLNSGNGGECDDMACCDPVAEMRRINPDDGSWQVSYDGGVTWQPDPSAPVTHIQKPIPPVTSGAAGNKCDAASNALQHITDMVNEQSSNIATAGDIFELAVLLATGILTAFIIFVTGGAASPLALAVAGAIFAAGSAAFEMGQTAFDLYWDTDAYDKVLCALYNHISEAGDFNDDQYNAFMTELKSELDSSPARDLVTTALSVGGAVGLSVMASYGGSADSDCSECEPPAFVKVGTPDLAGSIVGLFPDEDGWYTTPLNAAQGDGFWSFVFIYPENTIPVDPPIAKGFRIINASWSNGAVVTDDYVYDKGGEPDDLAFWYGGLLQQTDVQGQMTFQIDIEP